jgi:hypothetical protein
MSQPIQNLVIYRVKAGMEEKFLPILKQHGPALKKSGLITDQPVQTWSAKSIRKGTTVYVEMFQWKDDKASDDAHQSPEVMRVWEPMTPMLEELEILQPLTPIA